MSARPRLAVLAVLAAGGTAFGGYYLWPSGRHLASCAPKHAPVPAAARAVLAAYAHRIEHTVERTRQGMWSDSWSDPTTGRMRQLSHLGVHSVETGFVPDGAATKTILVSFQNKTWMSDELPFPRATGNEPASLAQAARDKVADGKATIVGRAVVDGHATLHLRELVHLPEPTAPPGVHVPKALAQPRVLHVDTWVDPLTYLPIRMRTGGSSGWSVSDTSWLPRTPANVAETRIVIPPGFEHATQSSGNFTSYTDAVAFRCNQS